jgi:predicted amidohydrolase YtcJ
MGFMVDADVVLFNGNVITVDGKKARAQGIAIKDGRIL